MSLSFFQSILDPLQSCQNGLFAIITHSPTPEIIGQKAFLCGVHPISQSANLSAFWQHFFEQLSPEHDFPSVIEFDHHKIFVERLSSRPHLILLGGGHVSYFVYQLGVMLGFAVTVVDEREEFCNPSRFPKAQTICKPFSEALPQLPCNNSTYYVIVTRGHQHDYECLSYLLSQPPCAYLGMIGSRRKVGLVHQSLLEEGFSQKRIDCVFSPIGLPIHAQTPEEISVSILAQIIEVKNSRTIDSSLEDPALIALSQSKEPLVFCMIVRKSGSIPRGAGSKMVVDKNGNICGTIGGGKIEYDVIQTAKRLLLNHDRTPVFQTFYMDNNSAKDEGMICGGSADVMIKLCC